MTAPGGPGLVPRRLARRRRLNSPLVVGTALSGVVGTLLIWRLIGGEPREPAPLDTRPNPVVVQRVEPKRPPMPASALPAAASLPAPVMPAAAAPPMPVPAPATGGSDMGNLLTVYPDENPERTQRQLAADEPSAPSRDARLGMGRVDFKPFAMQGAESGVVTDLAHTIKPTTRALCTLVQAIDAQHEGPLVCSISADVLSWDLSTVLLPKGTPVIGSYQALSVGQGRLMALAANAFRGDGVVVPLGAPFTDDLGRNGIPGYVDTRWFERFGNAIIMDAALALINLPQAALTSRQPGTTNLNFNMGQSENVLSEVLRGSVNLPPILRKNQGEDIAILITQPIHVGATRLVRD